jgi:hypothetical protein
LYRMPIQEFLTMDHQGQLNQYALDAPLATVEIAGRHGAVFETPFRRTLLLSAVQENGMMYVARTDQSWVVEMPVHVFESLFVGLETLRSKQLLALDRFQVHRIEIEIPHVPRIVLERDIKSTWENPKWHMLAPKPGLAKAHLMTSLILAYADVKGIERVVAGPDAQDPQVLEKYGFTNPIRIAFSNQKNREMGELWLGAKEGENAFATTKNGDMIVRIPLSRLDVLPRDPSAFREKKR